MLFSFLFCLRFLGFKFGSCILFDMKYCGMVRWYFTLAEEVRVESWHDQYHKVLGDLWDTGFVRCGVGKTRSDSADSKDCSSSTEIVRAPLCERVVTHTTHTWEESWTNIRHKNMNRSSRDIRQQHSKPGKKTVLLRFLNVWSNSCSARQTVKYLPHGTLEGQQQYREAESTPALAFATGVRIKDMTVMAARGNSTPSQSSILSFITSANYTLLRATKNWKLSETLLFLLGCYSSPFHAHTITS